jgi:hypothetical protein
LYGSGIVVGLNKTCYDSRSSRFSTGTGTFWCARFCCYQQFSICKLLASGPLFCTCWYQYRYPLVGSFDLKRHNYLYGDGMGGVDLSSRYASWSVHDCTGTGT